MARISFLLLSCLLGVSQLSAQDSQLSRRAFLGVQASPLTEEQTEITDFGVNILRVFPNSTASSFGLEEGQIILEANGRRLESPSDLPIALRGLRSGSEVQFVLRDEDMVSEIDLQLQAFPEESYESGNVIYDSVTSGNGRQRSILTLPQNTGAPVVYILQGFDCSSIDFALNSTSTMALLVEQLHENGFATYRVEKTGRGDSEGIDCLESGFDAETEGFAAGLTALANNPAIDADRIYLLGISLGGVWAPILAGQHDLAGIISFGTISKTWPEYMYDNWRRQWDLAGKSSATTDADLKRANGFWYQLINEELAPSEILTDSSLAPLSSSVGYQEEGQLLFGRHYSFVRELASTNIMSYWEQVRVPSLLIWGRGDYIASEEDQRLIYEVLRSNEVDVELEYLDVDHYWREAADFETAWSNLRNRTQAPINDEVYSSIIDWLSARG